MATTFWRLFDRSGGASRRDFLKSATTLAGGAAAASTLGAPYVHAQEPITLRYAGTGVNAFKELADKCKEDTGITIQYTTLTSDDVVKRAVTQPSSFDMLDSEYWMLKKIIPSGNLRGMDVKKVKEYDKIVPIFTKGQLPDGSQTTRVGIAPIKVSYLPEAESTEFVEEPTGFMTLIPTVYNADTLGIRPDLIGRPIESWAELVNPEFKGKASILNVPAIGIMDAGQVAQAVGIVKYGDMGNMTKQEIDKTIAFLIETKKAGQFRGLWKEFNESVNWMASGETVIQSMWSPAITKVRQQGIPCVYQPLKEGYRAWAAGLGIPTHVEGRTLDACYEFVNWFLSGWAGAFLNRQGYYTAVLDTAKENMTADEWGYWMEGKPCVEAIKSPTGEELAKPGEIRDGGSFYERMGNVTVWNTVMDEDRYMVRKWNEFVAA
ncbi:MAG TPA: PotD/PotF family extracellular solute-binding protein [Geminicoccus sp.]|jgi:putative spermidine/putrescine transport system substrate-binding protein|uniref:ABC transporter substrate-binding protein n=1 Tax=Geminicoccus sp. TaxID=2024832 RepID=UPI002E2EDBE7|nr:PotD/PotF family extracellular solute-binding protein [Geminicoccus sp.]HEX2526478.1 PotD/PotF family extracellular solute-binding protein [Geminicoccus sp.]